MTERERGHLEQGDGSDHGGGGPTEIPGEVHSLCYRCGSEHTPSDKFCATCGAYLNWADSGAERTEDPRAEAPHPVGGHQGHKEHREDAEDTEDAEEDAQHTQHTQHTEDAEDGEWALHTEDAGPRPHPIGGRPATDPGSIDLLDTWLHSGPSPFAPPVPPSARQPQLLTVRGSHHDHASTGWNVQCPHCERMNAPDRFFCRACGMPMELVSPQRPPWWGSRVLTRAGDAVYRWWERGRLMRRLRILLTLAAAGILAARLVDANPVHTARVAFAERTGPRSQVRPSGVEASSSAVNQRPGLSVDGATNTYWAPDPALPPAQQHLDLTFAAPIRLIGVVVYAGASQDPTKYLTQARPAAGTLVLVSASGRTRRMPFQLSDRPGPHPLVVTGTAIVAVHVYVTKTYGTRPGLLAPVAEVEFYERG